MFSTKVSTLIGIRYPHFYVFSFFVRCDPLNMFGGQVMKNIYFGMFFTYLNV